MPSKRIYFLSNCCHVCKSSKTDFNCEICGLISYCSPEHRQQHWQAHSFLCRAVYKICQQQNIKYLYDSAFGKSSEVFRNLRHRAASDCIAFLERRLESWELEMLYHPKICDVCYKSDGNLTACPKCSFVFTCSSSHFKKQHSQWCKTLKSYVEIIKYLHSHEIPIVPDINISMIPTSMIDLIQQNVIEDIKDKDIIHCFQSEIATYPLTVLQNLNVKGDITVIHLVGAELQAEVLPLKKWETYLLHLLPACHCLNLVFVGPELQATEDMSVKINFDVCAKCKEAGKRISFEFVPETLYHDFIQANGNMKSPNLVATMNAGLYRSSGFGGSDTWRPTLDVLLKDGSTPVLITEYTSYEINQDFKLVNERFPGLQILKKPTVNQFAGIKPSLNIISDDEVPVIFKNYYCMLLAK